MVDHTIDLASGASASSGLLCEASPRVSVKLQGFVLTPGESAAYPPGETPHWSLRTRVGVLLGLVSLTWATVGGLLLLLRH